MQTADSSTNTRALTMLAVFTAAVFAVVGLAPIQAAAAPHQDYFSATTSNQSTSVSFFDWLDESQGEQLAQCDAFNTVFSSECGRRDGSVNNTSNIAGVAGVIQPRNDEDTSGGGGGGDTAESAVAAPQLTFIEQWCAGNDGSIEFKFENVRSYEILRGGEVYEIVDFDTARTMYQSFAMMPDGSYTLTVSTGNNHASAHFTIACDEEDDGGGDGDDGDELTGQCSVSPQEVAVGEPVIWSVSANGGIGSYTFDWFGDVSGSSATVESMYNTPGTKTGKVTITSGDDSLTASCDITVLEDEEEGEVRGRTIEEF